MTERLYLRDPYLRSFRARVVEVRDAGGRPAVVLDRSAFYPEGGGQPGDRGTLSGVPVLDTRESDGAMLHLLERALPQAAEVDGELDWARRFDHMQQHHGQHLLSAAFERALGAATVSFHLGERSCTIDLDIPAARLDAKALRGVEAACNDAIFRNLTVVAREFGPEERSRLALRKEPVKGDRVVVVEGVDASPCGGTHPARTGEVGSVAILKAQRWGEGKARVEFACGARVVRLLAEANEVLAGAADGLRCAPADLAQAAQRSVAEAQGNRKAMDGLLADLARLEAAALRSQGDLVVARVERGAAFARAVASALVASGATALIASVHDGRAYLAFARPKGAGAQMSEVLREALAVLGGKGGGGPELAQGSGDPARLEEALAVARRRLAP